MAQLNSELMVNGTNLYQFYGFKSVLITGSATRFFGSERSVNVSSRTNGMLTSYVISKTRPKLTIELVKVNKKTGRPTPITRDDLRDLSMILFKNDVCVLQERNIVYYGWFVKGSNWFNGANQGYLTLEYELASPYCYSPVQTESFLIQGSKAVQLRNVATADEDVYSRIRIIGMEDGDVVITNRTTNNKITIKNVKKNEEVIVEGETREIYSVTNPSENMYSRLEYTKDYLLLKYSDNDVFIEGKCQIEFVFQCPMIIV